MGLDLLTMTISHCMYVHMYLLVPWLRGCHGFNAFGNARTMYMGCKEGGGQPVDKAVGCTNAGLAQYLCLVMEETEEPAVTTSSTWRGRRGRRGRS